MFESTFNFLTYEAQNIFIYFVLIAGAWCLSLDYKLRTKLWITSTYFIVLAILLNLHSYLFYYDQLIKFLQYMAKYGYNYTKASIVFCILYPLFITIVIMLIPRRK